MKNLILTTILLLVVNLNYGQSLKEGNLLGLHVMEITLDPDVTMNQFQDFLINKWIPAFEKNFQGGKVLVLKGVRGENKDDFATLNYFKSEKDRNKYWNDDGSPTESGESAMGKMDALLTEMQKLGSWTSTYTDWVVQ
jgi:hypothetical protein